MPLMAPYSKIAVELAVHISDMKDDIDDDSEISAALAVALCDLILRFEETVKASRPYIECSLDCLPTASISSSSRPSRCRPPWASRPRIPF